MFHNLEGQSLKHFTLITYGLEWDHQLNVCSNAVFSKCASLFRYGFKLRVLNVYEIDTKGQCYNSILIVIYEFFVISQSVRPRQAFQACSNKHSSLV
jgi:hypothetical protein